MLMRMVLLSAHVLVPVLAILIVPENGLVRTALLQKPATSSSRRRLFLENSPLLGGPPWLPVHVKVILHDQVSSVEHRWDFLPKNAAELSTLQRLLTLQAVPAETRYQSAPMPSAAQERIASVPDILTYKPTAGFDIILAEVGSEPVASSGNFVIETGSDEIITNPGTETTRLVEKANKFCEVYPKELHLIQNNCWRFAFKLYDHLYL